MVENRLRSAATAVFVLPAVLALRAIITPLLLCLAGLALPAVPAAADTVPIIDLRLLSALTALNKDDMSLSAVGTGIVGFAAQGDKNVKAEFSLRAAFGDTAFIDVRRAYVKARFPLLRLTAGKAPMSWGEGTVYNAGDVMFRDYDASSDFMSETLRDNALWLASFYIPFGPFSFFEGAVFPPPLNLTELLSDPGAAPVSISETGAGGRFYFKLGTVKIEPGYVYDGRSMVHLPFLSLQGNLGLDWNLSASVAVPYKDANPENVYDTLAISWGLFYPLGFRTGGSLSLRLEGMIRPAAAWSQDAARAGRTDPAGSPAPRDYGILLYPEIVWSADSALSLMVRSIISPVDASALIMPGITWNVFQGLSFLGFICIQAGEEEDLYGYPKPGWFTATAGVQHRY